MYYLSWHSELANIVMVNAILICNGGSLITIFFYLNTKKLNGLRSMRLFL